MTVLARDPALWDTVFREPPARARFIAGLAARRTVLDIGCATGELCRALRARGIAVTGVDLNAAFVAAARAKCDARFIVGDMATFRASPAHLVCCLGTTFAYNLTNERAAVTLANLRRHTRRGGRVVIDVLNAIAFTGSRPFRARTRHAFVHANVRHTATIEHRLELATQTMTEQVTWRIGRTTVRDRAERLRLWFPQELAYFVGSAGFTGVELFDGYGTRSRAFDGRRLVVIATR